MQFRSRSLALLTLAGALAASGCTDNASPAPTRGFLDGTTSNPDIGLFINSTSHSLLMFQLGDPDQHQEIAFGASTTITPAAFAVRGHLALVPLGDAASVNLVDLESNSVVRTFTFGGGNATGAAWVDDTTAIVANFLDDYVGRIYIHQAGDAITDTVSVTPAPSSVIAHAGRVFVISSNLDQNYLEIGDAVLTEVNPATMTIVDTITTGGRDAQYGAFGPDGKLYVVNTGEYFPADAQGSLAVYSTAVDAAPTVVEGFGNAPGPITIDAAGRAVISSYSYGSVVYHTGTGAFLRGPDNPLCAPATTGCRTASDAAFAGDGRIYQSFYGSTAGSIPGQIFLYDATTYALIDSIAIPVGPSGLQVINFR